MSCNESCTIEASTALLCASNGSMQTPYATPADLATSVPTSSSMVLGLGATVGILLAIVLVQAALLLIAVRKLRQGTMAGSHKCQMIEAALPQKTTENVGNPMYEVHGTAATQNAASSVPSCSTADVDRRRADSLYTTIPQEGGTAFSIAAVRAAALMKRQSAPEDAAHCTTGKEERKHTNASSSSGPSQLNLVAPHDNGEAVAGLCRKECGDEATRSRKGATSPGQADPASEAATTAVTRVETSAATAAGAEKQKDPCRPVGESIAENARTKRDSLPNTPTSPSAAKADDPEENYATISDIVGSDEEDPYCLVGPSSETNSLCSEVFVKESRAQKPKGGHLGSGYESVSLNVLTASVGAKGAETDAISDTLLTDNPCHNEETDWQSYRGDAYNLALGCETATATVRTGSAHHVTLSGESDPSQRNAMGGEASNRNKCVPVITILSSTPQTDETVAKMISGDSSTTSSPCKNRLLQK